MSSTPPHSTPEAPRRTHPRAWLVWGVGVLAYAAGIMQRTSLGVIGLPAAEHFGTSVGIVSTFVVVQVAVYAIMQIPAGLLLDRFGSRVMLVTGALVMGLAQLSIGLVDDLRLAVATRILLGIGDACMFSSILRLIPFWFHPQRVPILSQLTGLLGQLGQIAAVASLPVLMLTYGWRPTMAFAAGTCFVMAIFVFAVLRDVPPGEHRVVSRFPLRDVPRELGKVTGHPAVQLGFWIHMAAGFPIHSFVAMWGVPYMIIGQGRTAAEAALLFSLTALFSAAMAPIFGWLTARHPLRRSNLALTTVYAIAGLWALTLLWPGYAPMWLLVALVVAISIGGPGTGVGFDFPRTDLPPHQLGVANGVVITGAFSASTVLVLVVGMVLDLMSPSGDYTARQMNLAMLIHFPFFAVGLWGIYSSRRRLRRLMAERGTTVPTWREVAGRYRRRRFR